MARPGESGNWLVTCTPMRRCFAMAEGAVYGGRLRCGSLRPGFTAVTPPPSNRRLQSGEVPEAPLVGASDYPDLHGLAR